MQSNNMISMTITTVQLEPLYDSHFFTLKSIDKNHFEPNR